MGVEVRPTLLREAGQFTGDLNICRLVGAEGMVIVDHIIEGP